MAAAAHAAEVGVVLQVQRKVGGDMAREAVVELKLHVDIGLEGTALQPAHTFQFLKTTLGGSLNTGVLGAGTIVALNTRIKVVGRVNRLPTHVLRLRIVVEELYAGVEVEVGRYVLLQVLRADVATEGEVSVLDVLVGLGVLGVEGSLGIVDVVLYDTIVEAVDDEPVVADEGRLAGQERERHRPVGLLVLKSESRGQVGGGEEVGDQPLAVLGGLAHSIILVALAELGLQVGRQAGAPALVGVPRQGARQVDLVVALAARLEEHSLGVEVLPRIAVGQVGHIVPHELRVRVLVVAEER